MSQYIGVKGVARKVVSQYVGVSSVARKVTNGYVGVDGVARKFYPSEASAITNFKKTSKAYNYIYFSWTNPSSNYTGVRIQARTGSYPTTTSTGTNVYHGVGTNTAAGKTNTSGKVSLSISSRSSTTYYFSAWAYRVENGKTVYSNTYSTDSAALVCNDCCDTDCDETYVQEVCSCDHVCECYSVDRCRPWDEANADCGSVWVCGCDAVKADKTGCNEWQCDECEDYPKCGNVKY